MKVFNMLKFISHRDKNYTHTCMYRPNSHSKKMILGLAQNIEEEEYFKAPIFTIQSLSTLVLWFLNCFFHDFLSLNYLLTAHVRL